MFQKVLPDQWQTLRLSTPVGVDNNGLGIDFRTSLFKIKNVVPGNICFFLLYVIFKQMLLGIHSGYRLVNRTTRCRLIQSHRYTKRCCV